MRKKVLGVSVAVLLVFGVILASSPFYQSMHPSQKAKAARSQHNISTLDYGDFRFDEFQKGSAWDEVVLIIKDWDGEIYSFLILTDHGKVIMPETWYWWGYYHCKEFGPELDENNKLKKNGVIQCHDSDIPEFWKDKWLWSYEGKVLGNWAPDLPAPNHEIKGGYLYLNR